MTFHTNHTPYYAIIQSHTIAIKPCFDYHMCTVFFNDRSDLWSSSSSAAADPQKCNSVVLVADGKTHTLDARNGQVRSSLLVINSKVETSHYW